MDERIVKPIFWPVLIISCLFLSMTMLFLIGGMLSNRLEDYFISALVGLIMFAAARTVRTNVTETPKLAMLMLFFWPTVILLFTIVMINALGDLSGSAGQVFSYLNEMQHYRSIGFPIPEDIQRSFFLSSGILSAVVFIVAQILACFLLLVGTKPERKEHRH